MDFLNKTYHKFYSIASRTDEELRRYVLPMSNLFGKLAIGGGAYLTGSGVGSEKPLLVAAGGIITFMGLTFDFMREKIERELPKIKKRPNQLETILETKYSSRLKLI